MPKKRVTKKKSATTRNRAGTTAPASAGKTAGKAKQAKSSGGAAGKAKAKARRPANRAARQADAPLAQLEHLISMMVEKEVVEVEFEQAGTRWRVRRAEPHVTYTQAAPMPMAMPQGAAMPGMPMPMAAAVDTAEPEPQGEVFKSPMVGTFYRAASPDAEPFCKPGDQVASDRTLCIIEAMKVMNEIKAEREFEILDVLVKNGESVEFGQPLFLIR